MSPSAPIPPPSLFNRLKEALWGGDKRKLNLREPPLASFGEALAEACIEEMLLNSCSNIKGYLWLFYDKGPVDQILILTTSSFLLGVLGAKLATFVFVTATRLGTIAGEYVDNELFKLTQRSQNLSGFDKVSQKDVSAAGTDQNNESIEIGI